MAAVASPLSTRALDTKLDRELRRSRQIQFQPQSPRRQLHQQKDQQDRLAHATSFYYPQRTSVELASPTTDDPPPSYSPPPSPSALTGTSTPKRRLSLFRSAAPSSPPEPAVALTFRIRRPPQSLLSRKAYDITTSGTSRDKVIFHATFPHTAFGLSSRPNILVQRAGPNGTVVGEVRFHSMHPDEVVLPAFGASGNGAAPEATKVTCDRLWSSRKKVRYGGRDYYWRRSTGGSGSASRRASVASRMSLDTRRSLDTTAPALGDGGNEEPAVTGRWKCQDAEGNLFAVVSRAAPSGDEASSTIASSLPGSRNSSIHGTGGGEVGRITITREGLCDQDIEALVVTGLAVLEKEERD